MNKSLQRIEKKQIQILNTKKIINAVTIIVFYIITL